MKDGRKVWCAAPLLLMSLVSANVMSLPKADPPAKPLTRAEIAKLPIPREARAELVVRMSPNDVRARLDAAREYLGAARDTPQNVAQAERHLRALLKLDPNNFDGLLLAGDAATRSRQPVMAMSYYQRAVQINPQHAGAQLRLGQALQQTGDSKGSDAAYDAYRRLNHLPPMSRQTATNSK